jgi:hypothetical protein
MHFTTKTIFLSFESHWKTKNHRILRIGFNSWLEISEIEISQKILATTVRCGQRDFQDGGRF